MLLMQSMRSLAATGSGVSNGSAALALTRAFRANRESILESPHDGLPSFLRHGHQVRCPSVAIARRPIRSCLARRGRVEADAFLLSWRQGHPSRRSRHRLTAVPASGWYFLK